MPRWIRTKDCLSSSGSTGYVALCDTSDSSRVPWTSTGWNDQGRGQFSLLRHLAYMLLAWHGDKSTAGMGGNWHHCQYRMQQGRHTRKLFQRGWWLQSSRLGVDVAGWLFQAPRPPVGNEDNNNLTCNMRQVAWWLRQSVSHNVDGPALC
jgi:hypothetical protein